MSDASGRRGLRFDLWIEQRGGPSMPLIRAVSVNSRRRGSPCLLGEEK